MFAMHIHIGTLVAPFQCLLHHLDFHVPLYRSLFIFDLVIFLGEKSIVSICFLSFGIVCFFYGVVHWSSSSKSRNYLVCMLLFGQNERARHLIYFGSNILPIWKIRFNDSVIQLARENGQSVRDIPQNPIWILIFVLNSEFLIALIAVSPFLFV